MKPKMTNKTERQKAKFLSCLKNTGFYFLLICLQACTSSTDQPTDLKQQPFCLDDQFKKNIRLLTVQEQAIVETIHLTGSVESNPDKTVHFVSLVTGVVVHAPFSLGDYVKKGQTLIDLRSTELSNLQAEETALSSQIQVAKRELQTATQMYKEGLYSEKDFLVAQSELNTLVATHKKVKSDLALYQASEKKGVFEIKASISGFITEKNVAPGTSVSPDGQILFTISDLNDVWVMANVYASNINNIKTGMNVSMTTLSYGDETFEGKISLIPHVMDEDAKVLKARIVFENKDLKLKPGMLVDIHALKEYDQKAIKIPTSALIFSDNKNYVVVYKTDCDLEIREVNIRTQNNEYTFISEGLANNEQLVVENQLLIFGHFSPT